jgi:hypothetical protein
MAISAGREWGAASGGRHHEPGPPTAWSRDAGRLALRAAVRPQQAEEQVGIPEGSICSAASRTIPRVVIRPGSTSGKNTCAWQWRVGSLSAQVATNYTGNAEIISNTPTDINHTRPS